MALLAFNEPNSSPVGDLMQLAQRQKTAGELNAAILTAQVNALLALPSAFLCTVL
jgi:hypothetical protein